MKRKLMLMLGILMMAIGAWADNVTLTLLADGCSTPNTLTCPAGTEVEINAEAINPGLAFSHWSDDYPLNPRTITVNNDMTITAYYATSHAAKFWTQTASHDTWEVYRTASYGEGAHIVFPEDDDIFTQYGKSRDEYLIHWVDGNLNPVDTGRIDMSNADMNFYAQLEKRVVAYEATFQYIKGSIIPTLTTFHSAFFDEGSTVEFPSNEEVAQKYGISLDLYDVLWYDAEVNEVTPGAELMPSNNATYTAVVSAKSFLATFLVQTGPKTDPWTEQSSASFAPGEKIVFPTDAVIAAAYGKSLTNYDIEWQDENDVVIDPTNVTMGSTNVEYYAVLKEKIITYTVSFLTYTGTKRDPWAELSSDQLVAGAKVNFPPDAAVAAAYGVSLSEYDVVWTDEDDNILTLSEVVMPAAETSYYANVIKKQAVVTFRVKTGPKTDPWVELSSAPFAEGDKVIFPSDADVAAAYGVSLANYDIEWQDENDVVIDPANVTMGSTDVDYYAYYVEKTTRFTVSFLKETGIKRNPWAEFSNAQFAIGEIVSFPTDADVAAVYGVSLSEYDIVWTDEDDNILTPGVFVMPNHDIALYASIKEKQPTAYFLVQTGNKSSWVELSSAAFAPGEKIVFPSDADVAAAYGVSLADYDIEWQDENDVVIDPTNVSMGSTDVEYYAYYVEKKAPKFTASFLTQTGKKDRWVEFSNAQFTVGEIVSFPTDAAVAAVYGVSLDNHRVVWTDIDDNILTPGVFVMPAQDIELYASVEEGIIPVPVITDDMVTRHDISGKRYGITISSNGRNVTESVISAYLSTLSNLDQLVYVDLTNCWYEEFNTDYITTTGINPNCLYYFNSAHKGSGYIRGKNAIYSQVNSITGITEYFASDIELQDKYAFYNKYAVKEIEYAEFVTAAGFSTSQWTFLTVPFDVKTAGENGSDFYVSRFNEYVEADVIFNFKQCSDVDAGKPYAFKLKPGMTASSIYAYGTSMPATTTTCEQVCYDATTNARAIFRGALEKTYLDGRGAVNGGSSDYSKYYAIAGGNFSRVYNANLHALRAYIEVPATTSNNINSSAIFLFEMDEDNYDQMIIDPTAIDGVSTDLDELVIDKHNHAGTSAVNDNRIYSMDGKYVGMDADVLPRGLYIRNNVKFFVR